MSHCLGPKTPLIRHCPYTYSLQHQRSSTFGPYIPHHFSPHAHTTSAHIDLRYQIHSANPHIALRQPISKTINFLLSASLTTPSCNIFLASTPRPPFFHNFLTVPAALLASPTLKLTSTSMPPSLPANL